MQCIDLLSSNKEASDLTSFAERLFLALNVHSYEERESSNYVNGHYFRGYIDALSFVVAIADDEGNEDLPYRIHVDAQDVIKQNLSEIVDRIVRERMLTSGFQVARMVNFGRKDEQRLDY